MAAPLTHLLRGGIDFCWTLGCQQMFEKVKMLLTEGPVLKALRFDQPFQLQVDSSNVGAGAVLLQTSEDGIDHPVRFFSRKFNSYQLNYSVIEKEVLALIWALQHFEVKSSQVTFIYIALLITQIVSKQLHNIKIGK